MGHTFREYTTFSVFGSYPQGRVMMTVGQEMVFTQLKALGLLSQIRRPSSSVRTAEETAREFGVPLSRIARTVATTTAEDQVVLIVGPASRRLDLKAIGSLLHTRLRTVPKADVLQVTGYSPDGVSPVPGPLASLVLIDAALEEIDGTLLAAGGSADHLVELTFHELLRLSTGRVIDFDAAPSPLRWYMDSSAFDLGVRAEFLEIQGVSPSATLEGFEEFVRDAAAAAISGEGPWSPGYTSLLHAAGVTDQLPSTVSLRTFVQNNHRLPRVNTVVDCYNAVSLLMDVVVSAHDADHLQSPLWITRTAGNDLFRPIGSKKPVQMRNGEWCIRDQRHLLCRNNCKQSELSKIRADTGTLLVYVQGYAEMPRSDMLEAINLVGRSIVNYCGGKRSPVVQTEGPVN
jgi:prolyl-tRNA editing enzyme YbaK/EbsC (Cys-tRNA(Pro) deacylase)